MSNLSDRAKKSLQRPIDPLWNVANDRYCPKFNPAGYVNLGVAENSLLQPELTVQLQSSPRNQSWELSYGEGPGGTWKLRRSIANFINRHFKPVHQVYPAHIRASYGVSASLQRCAFALGDRGDFVLLGRPYYASFAHELGHRAGVRILPVGFNGLDPLGIEAVACYEEALETARLEGKRVRALLLCNPHNPLGRCYSRGTLIEFMRFCQKHNIHLVVDEVYALSTWHNPYCPDAAPFVSALSIDTSGIVDARLVHVLWGLSKDFGANGLRVGCLMSQHNPEFLDASTSCAPEGYTSPLLERMAIEILDDVAFTDWYIAENRRRIQKRYMFLVSFLRHHDLAFHEGSNAGFFVWVDLSSYWLRECCKLSTAGRNCWNCSKHSAAEKESLAAEIGCRLLEHKIYVCDGHSFGSEKPGYVRIVYTQPLLELQEGLKRMIAALSTQRKPESDCEKEETASRERRTTHGSIISQA